MATGNGAPEATNNKLSVKEKTIIMAALTAYAVSLQRQIDKEANDNIRELREQDRNIAITLKQRTQGGQLQ